MSDLKDVQEEVKVEDKKPEAEQTEMQEVAINTSEEQAATPKEGKDEAEQPMIEKDKKKKKEKKEKSPKVVIEIGDRDPNSMNDHVRVLFEDVIAEPDDSSYSFDNVWLLSQTVFRGTKLWCYRITSVICALPLSVIWGLYFACLAFCNIWICMPGLRSYEIELYCVKRVWSTLLNTCVAPCFEAMGRCFSGIVVNHKQN